MAGKNLKVLKKHDKSIFCLKIANKCYYLLYEIAK